MIIKKLKLINFRQYYNENIIEFSQDKERNITLVLGDNTSGKTTLLQAFLWVFYGKANFKSKEALLNSKRAEELLQAKDEVNVEIEIELDHQGVEYTITRKLLYYFKNKEIKANKISEVKMSYKNDNGETESITTHKIINKISEILPENLSPYFLYDTERFDSVSTKSDVTNSVKSILGLKVLENMQAHLGTISRSKTVIGKFYESLNNKGNKSSTEAQIKLTEFTEQKEKLFERIKSKEKELENYRNLVFTKQNILKELEESANLQLEKEKNEMKLKELSISKESTANNFNKLFQQNSWQFLGRPLFLRIAEELEDAKLDKKAIRDMNANAIRDIIERGECVCGAQVEKGNEAYNRLLEEIRYLPPESIGTLIKYFKEKSDTFYESSNEYFTGIDTTYKSWVNLQNTMGDLEDEIQSLNEEIGQKDDVAKHQNQLLEFELKVKSLTQELNNMYQTLGVLDKNIINSQEEYEKNLEVSQKNQEIKQYLKYAEEILAWVKTRYVDREKEIRDQLEEKVNLYFQKMYHGSREVKITSTFEVKLITTDLKSDIQTDESQGLGTVKNFAFIAGLVDLAKEKLSNSIEKESEEYPLILDAPFSNADEKHVENISNILPEVANQLILIVMSKDWNYAEKSLNSKVGKKYILDKQTEIHTVIKEVNE